MDVVDPETMQPVPRDGKTMGEIVMRGNNVMLGYYKDPEATAAAFKGGWFHSGDLAVMHPDNYIQIMDRKKDIIRFCKENLARFKAPKYIAFGELPKTATGKIQKFKLREKEWQGRGRKAN
jgi:fatty-acyl-CoA synthase